MRKAELVFLSLFLCGLLLQTINGTGIPELSFLLVNILGLYYTIRALFSKKKLPQRISDIVTAIIIWLALLSFMYTIFMFKSKLWTLYLPLLGLAWCVFSYFRNGRKFNSPTLIILFILSSSSLFLGWRNPHFKLSNKILYTLNANRPNLQANLKMHEYGNMASEYLDIGDCNNALNTSHKSIEEAIKWLSISDSNLNNIPEDVIWQFSGALTKNYSSYSCLGDQYFNSKDYDSALYYYVSGDSVLNFIKDQRFDYWKREKAISKADIALTYHRLKKLDSSAHYYKYALETYQNEVGIKDAGFGEIVANSADLMFDIGMLETSIDLSIKGIELMKSDTAYLKKVGRSSIDLARTALALNDIQFADSCLDAASSFISENDLPSYNLTRASLAVRNSNFADALDLARLARIGYSEDLGDMHQNVAAVDLIISSYNYQIGKYDSAIFYCNRSQIITRTNHPPLSVADLKTCLVKAEILEQLGDYSQSEKEFDKVISNYPLDDPNASLTLLTAYMVATRSKIHKEEYLAAKELFNEVISNLKDIENRIEGGELYTSVADLALHLNMTTTADTLYQKAYDMIAPQAQLKVIDFANLNNGLALLKNQENDRDSSVILINESIKGYNQVFPKGHPHMATLHYNLGSIHYKNNNHQSALKFVDQGIKTFEAYHSTSHPVLADYFELKALILFEMGSLTEAVTYLEKSVELVRSSYGVENPKFERLQNELKSISYL